MTYIKLSLPTRNWDRAIKKACMRRPFDFMLTNSPLVLGQGFVVDTHHGTA